MWVVAAIPLNVLLADANPSVCESLRWALDDTADFVVVGEAQDGEEALRLAAETQPDIVILEIALPKRDGYAVARALKAFVVPPAVVFLSVHSDASFRQKAAEAGGDAFAEKGLGWPALISLLRETVERREKE